MAAVPRIDIVASKRVPFDDVVPDMRGNWAGATPLMEIRVEPGDGGTAPVQLGASVSGGEGIAITYDAAYPDPDGEEFIGASLIRIIVNETTLEGLAYGADASKPVALNYDLHLTPSGGKKFVAFGGAFIIEPGVTR